jgi:hypothetical protein
MGGHKKPPPFGEGRLVGELTLINNCVLLFEYLNSLDIV